MPEAKERSDFMRSYFSKAAIFSTLRPTVSFRHTSGRRFPAFLSLLRAVPGQQICGRRTSRHTRSTS